MLRKEFSVKEKKLSNSLLKFNQKEFHSLLQKYSGKNQQKKPKLKAKTKKKKVKNKKRHKSDLQILKKIFPIKNKMSIKIPPKDFSFQKDTLTTQDDSLESLRVELDTQVTEEQRSVFNKLDKQKIGMIGCKNIQITNLGFKELNKYQKVIFDVFRKQPDTLFNLKQFSKFCEFYS